MRRSLLARVVLGVLLICGVISGLDRSVFGLTQDETLYPWVGDQGVSIISKGPVIKEVIGCSTRTESISFRGGYSAVACVYGDPNAVRVARYTNQGGLPVIGVAYPGEDKYSEIYGVCEGLGSCAYSASRDVLVDSRTSRFYVGFVKSLVKMTNPINGVPYYQFSSTGQARYISVSGPMIFNAATVSMDGKWAVVEAYEYGFVRVDLDTFHERRIATSGARYGVANDPSYELAISNSGREFVVVGYRAGISLYQVDNYCGDVLQAQSTFYFANPSVPCRIAAYYTGMLPGFQSAHSPVFSDDGMRLGLSVYSAVTRERVIAAPAQTVPVQNEMLYLALGDSYTSGEGETDNKFYQDGTDQATNKCHLSTRSYPYLVGQMQGIERAKSVACSGAQMNDVSGATAYNGQKSQMPQDEIEKITINAQALAHFTPGVMRQIDFVGKYQPKTVSISIGGNDAGLMDKLNTCIGPGVCEWAKDPSLRLASANEIQQLYGKLRSVIGALRAASPSTQILFIGYPRIINEAVSAPCSLALSAMLSTEERQFMDESIKVLNDTVKSAALSEGSRYIDIEDVFVGHRLCEGDARAMNGLRVGDDIAPIKNVPLKFIGAESFHPTPYGHSLIASRISEQIPHVLDTNFSEAVDKVPQPQSSYWTNGVDSGQLRRLLKAVIAPSEITSGQQISIVVSARQFRSLSSATLEIHSDIQRLGVVDIKDNGGGSATVTIPMSTPSGFHTLHLLGESSAGDLLDVYQVVKVMNENDSGALLFKADNVEKDNVIISAPQVIKASQMNLSKGVSAAGPLQRTAPSPGVLGAFDSATISKNRNSKNDEDKLMLKMTTILLIIVGVVSLVAVSVLLLHRYIVRRKSKVGIIEL